MSNKLKVIIVVLVVAVVVGIIIYEVTSSTETKPAPRTSPGLRPSQPSQPMRPSFPPVAGQPGTSGTSPTAMGTPASGTTGQPGTPATPFATKPVTGGPAVIDSGKPGVAGQPVSPTAGVQPGTTPKPTSPFAPVPAGQQAPTGYTPTGTKPAGPAGTTQPPFPVAPTGTPGVGGMPGSMKPYTPPEPSFKEYTVKKGDSLWKIAKDMSNDTSDAYIAKLVDANKATIASKNAILKVGMKLKIPAADSKVKETAGAAPSSFAPGTKTYKIASGDSLAGISKKLFGSEKYWEKIWEANKSKLPNPNKLTVGTEIAIPDVEGKSSQPTGGPTAIGGTPAPTSGKTYKVQKGDSFSSISKKFFGSEKYWEKIWDANKSKVSDPKKIKEGIELVIPDVEGKKEEVKPPVTQPTNPFAPQPSTIPGTSPFPPQPTSPQPTSPFAPKPPAPGTGM